MNAFYQPIHTVTVSSHTLENQFGSDLIEKFGPYFPIHIEGNTGSFALLDKLPQHGFGIVGTRYPNYKTVQHLEETFKEIKNSDLVIVSGLARGIDARAHELAIENGLKTIAVLGCGLNYSYPQSNYYLRKKIIESGGLVITEYADNTPPYPSNFLNRNRWIALFSEAVWIVEASGQSGSLNTAGWAQKLNRQIFATPCFPNDPYLAGNESFLADHRASPLYNAESLWPVWPQFKSQEKIRLNYAQKRILEIATLDSISRNFVRTAMDLTQEHGLWHIQSLMNRCTISTSECHQYLNKFQEHGWIDSPKMGWYRFKIKLPNRGKIDSA